VQYVQRYKEFVVVEAGAAVQMLYLQSYTIIILSFLARPGSWKTVASKNWRGINRIMLGILNSNAVFTISIHFSTLVPTTHIPDRYFQQVKN